MTPSSFPTSPPAALRRPTLIGALCALLLAAFVSLAPAPRAHADSQLCDKFGSTSIAGGKYIVQNNEWGDDTPQCLTVTNSGFTISTASHNVPTNGAPAAYPSVYAGCHYGNCSANSGLPLQVSAFRDPRSTVTYRTAGGSWDAAYDIWLDSSPNPVGQNNGAEIMIWGAHAGPPQPAGSKVATAQIGGAGYDVWQGRLSNGGISWNVVSYVRQQNTTSLDVHIKDFTDDAGSRGLVDRSWYLTSVQFGFEPWVGGQGLAVDTFSFTTDGGGSTPPPAGGTIVGQASSRCLDVKNGDSADGTIVQLWDCNGAGAQRWVRQGEALVNPATGKCLDVSGGRTANGTVVQLWSCNGLGAQKWQFNADGTIVNTNSGACLDAVERGTAAGTRIQIWSCYGGGGTQPNQVWHLT
ncbi:MULTISPECIES: ricin-type beta-trefoil lectin domain protein [unclassified Streptomyces]|uniref:GH12 family glycosyl hydrolase domain-containing protein n=1 Tax=unclassified Streptomyces TaxID=2593676 RepID=UPI000DB9097A|nr:MULTISPECIES: ricin-type beta-trefoil lectin domain protein [unclassified Streptomyces]MYT68129.1 glycoside hydrolase [Streptomyces sp. SID8367]RAJ72695.1 endoglucanase [Streptomyces sp. PsTaAH-137]